MLAEVRTRGFSIPMLTIRSPAVMDAMARVRSEPTDNDAEQQLTATLQKTDQLLLLVDQLPGSEPVMFKTVAAPIFDSIGRVPLALSITGPGHPVPVDEVLQLGRRLVQSAAIATRQAGVGCPVRTPRPGSQPADGGRRIRSLDRPSGGLVELGEQVTGGGDAPPEPFVRLRPACAWERFGTSSPITRSLGTASSI